MPWSKTAPHRSSSRRGRPPAVALEGLESRIVLSTFNVAIEADLRSAINAADSNGESSNLINVTSSITLTGTELKIENPTSTAKTLTIQGQGKSPTNTLIAGSDTFNDRI